MRQQDRVMEIYVGIYHLIPFTPHLAPYLITHSICLTPIIIYLDNIYYTIHSLPFILRI